MYLIEKGKNVNICGKNMYRDVRFIFFRLLVLFYNRNRKYSVLLSVNMIVDGYK